MIKGFKVRLYPTEEQEKMLWDHIHAFRFVWNWGLAFQMDRFKNGEKILSGYDLKKEFVKFKYEDGNEWLEGISNKTSAMAVLDLDKAYRRFFVTQKKGEKFSKATIQRSQRTGKKLTPYDMKGHPKFKKKDKVKNSFYVNYEALYFNKNKSNIDVVNLEKIGKVHYRTDRPIPQFRKKDKDVEFINPRICYENNKWILSFGMICENQAVELSDYSVGVDVGVKDLAIVTYGNEYFKIKNVNKEQRVKKLKRRLTRLQKDVSRKYRANGSYEKTNNIKKVENEISKLHSRIGNIRKDYTHKASNKIVSLNAKSIVIEDLNVSGMMKNRHLSKAIQEQNLSEFAGQLEYKSEWRGIKLIKADRFYPSSKKCSCCGNIKADLKLKDRVYVCSECGLTIDRDINAAKNLESLAN